MDGTVQATPGGTAFTGPDGVKLYVAQTLISALRLYVKSGLKVNSGWTPSRMLRRAESITGKQYQQMSLHDAINQAISDLKVWIHQTMFPNG